MTCYGQISLFLVKTEAYQYFDSRSICKHLLKARHVYRASIVPLLMK